MTKFQVRVGKDPSNPIERIDCPGGLEEAIRIWRKKMEMYPQEEIHVGRLKYDKALSCYRNQR